jgi:NADH-quinone oxidoreductase subunit M
MITLSLIAVVYIGFVALVQTDMKKLIAYSSISHMGFVTLGFFIFNQLGVEGALVQMISHGFISAAMFLCVGVMYDRMHSRRSPITAAWCTPCRSSPRCSSSSPWPIPACRPPPASSASSWSSSAPSRQFLARLRRRHTLILGAAYTLWMIKRVVYGRPATTMSPNCRTSTAANSWSSACSRSACC